MAMRDQLVDDLLAEQIRYYRARAPEYDQTSPTASHPRWPQPCARSGVSTEPSSSAPGRAKITATLANIAGEVVAVDSSPEALEPSALKVPAPNVQRVVADVFEWTPPWTADLVLFAALLSHVPSERFADFWAAIDRMLAPGGRVFVLDEAPHALWHEERAETADEEVVTRTLSDGRRFRIVKVLWEPAALEARLAELGWVGRFTRHDPFFWGVVERSVEGG